jgi:hypothetical protein
MGGTCNTHGKDEECVLKFIWKTYRENTTGKTQALVGDTIETDLKEIIYEDMNGICQAPDRVLCLAFVIVIMNI